MRGRPDSDPAVTRSVALLLALGTILSPGLCSAQTSTLYSRGLSADRPTLQIVAEDSTGIISSRGAMLRSAVVPGWGQFYTGHPFKGLWMAGAAGTFVFLTLRADAEVADLAARRPDVTDPVLRAALEADIEQWRVERRRWLVWSATLWIYSVVDAYVDAQLHDFDATEPRFALGLIPSYRGEGAGTLFLTLGIPLGHH
jgi:TM2 domain-containing membrane protein YozV